MSTTARAKKHLDIQPSLLAYAAGISTLSPGLTAYQLTRVYGKAVPPTELARMSLRIFPHQMGLKWLQMNCANWMGSDASCGTTSDMKTSGSNLCCDGQPPSECYNLVLIMLLQCCCH